MTAVSWICSLKLLKLPVDSRLLENSNSFLIIQNFSSFKLFACRGISISKINCFDSGLLLLSVDTNRSIPNKWVAYFYFFIFFGRKVRQVKGKQNEQSSRFWHIKWIEKPQKELIPHNICIFHPLLSKHKLMNLSLNNRYCCYNPIENKAQRGSRSFNALNRFLCDIV